MRPPAAARFPNIQRAPLVDHEGLQSVNAADRQHVLAPLSSRSWARGSASPGGYARSRQARDPRSPRALLRRMPRLVGASRRTWSSIPGASTGSAAMRRIGKRSCASCAPSRCRRRIRGPTRQGYATAAAYLEAGARRSRRRKSDGGRFAALSALDSHRVPQRDSRLARRRAHAERARFRALAARRQREQRLRQHRRSAVCLARGHGALYRGGAEDRSARRRRHARAGDGEYPQALRATPAG